MSVVSTATTYTKHTLCCWNGSRHVGLYLPWNPLSTVLAEENQTRLKWSSRALTYFWTVLKLNTDCSPSGFINLPSTQESVWDQRAMWMSALTHDGNSWMWTTENYYSLHDLLEWLYLWDQCTWTPPQCCNYQCWNSELSSRVVVCLLKYYGGNKLLSVTIKDEMYNFPTKRRIIVICLVERANRTTFPFSVAAQEC